MSDAGLATLDPVFSPTFSPAFSSVAAAPPPVSVAAPAEAAPRSIDAPYQSKSAAAFYARAHMLMAIFFGLLMTSFTLVFLGNGDAMINIVICILYGLIYFGTPALIMSVGRANDLRSRTREDGDTDGRIPTFTGRLKRFDAYAQMLGIPAMMATTAFIMSLVFMFSRP